jgi:hypothetical protein
LLAFDSATNRVEVVNTKGNSDREHLNFPGPTTSMVVPVPGAGYAAVPSSDERIARPGAVVEMNLTSGGITATISVPGAQTVVSNPSGTQVLAFSNDSNAVTVVSPLAVK